MIRIAACLPLLLMLSCSSSGGSGTLGGTAGLPPCDERTASAKPPDGCGLVCRAEFPVTFVGRSPIATVWINDQPTQMLLDTGAGVTVLGSETATRLGLGHPTPAAEKLYGIGGSRTRGTVVVRKLAISYLRRDDMSVSVVELGGPKGYVPSGGVLGDDLLHDYEVDLDLPHNAVRLYQGRPCDGPLPGWRQEDGSVAFDTSLSGHHVVVPVRIDGKPAHAMIDSGAEAIVVNRQQALGSGVPVAELSDDLGTKMFGIGPDFVPGNLHRFATLDVAGQLTAPVETAVITLPFQDPGLILGEDYLQSHKVWISYATGRVHFAHLW